MGYRLADADVGKPIRVRVSFTDDRNHQETLTSDETAAVAAAEESSMWSAELTVGGSGSFYGYWKPDGTGELVPDGFNLDGNDHTVETLMRYGEETFIFALDQALPGDLTLRVGEATFKSDDAYWVNKTPSKAEYQWENRTPKLSDGDIVEVSLTLDD